MPCVFCFTPLSLKIQFRARIVFIMKAFLLQKLKAAMESFKKYCESKTKGDHHEQ